MKYDFDYKKKWKDVISEEEFNQLKDELRLELDDFENAEGLHEKRLHNLKLIKSGYMQDNGFYYQPQPQQVNIIKGLFKI